MARLEEDTTVETIQVEIGANANHCGVDSARRTGGATVVSS